MVGGVNFRQIWAWMSDGSGFSGSWERLTGIEATQDEVEEGLFGKGRGKMDPQQKCPEKSRAKRNKIREAAEDAHNHPLEGIAQHSGTKRPFLKRQP